MADEWTLVDVREIIEERTEVNGNMYNVFRRRVAHFIYERKSNEEYDWGNHNTETDLKGGETDTRTIEYGAIINPVFKSVKERKVDIDKTNWYFAHSIPRLQLPP